MTSVINDWLVEVGFDDSKVRKGVGRLEKTMSRLDKVSSRVSSKQTSRLNKQNEALKQQNRLESQRLSLRKKIAQAEQLGIKELKRERGALGGTNPVKIRSTVLELDKKITEERKKQRRVGQGRKAEAAKAKTEKASVFDLPEHRQAKIANTLDSVVRRAGRGLGETSEEFKKISTQANVLKDRIKDISSKTDLEKLNNEIRILRETTTQATAAIRKQNSVMTKQKFIAKGVTDSIRNMTRSYISVFAAMEGGRAAFNVGRDFENLRATLLLSSGSTEQAKSDFKFLVDVSRDLGLSLRDTSTAFSKFAVAANSADLTSEQTRETFTQLSSSIRATGLTQERANLAFLAFQQMLAGPVIQAQEMNQIIEQMPQFTGIAKKALAEMGMEVDNYREAVATGTVDSKEFVTTVARLMDAQARQTGAFEKSVNSLSAAQARFRTELELVTDSFFSAGARGGIAFFLDQLSHSLKALQIVIKPVGALLGGLLKALGGFVRLSSAVSRGILSIVEVISKAIKGVFTLKEGFLETNEIAQFLINTFKRVAGALLLPFGLLERFANVFDRLRDSLDFSGPVATVESLSKLGSEFGTSVSGTFKREFSKSPDQNASKINSDNSISVTIEGVETNNVEVIGDVVTNVLQDVMKRGM